MTTNFPSPSGITALLGSRFYIDSIQALGLYHIRWIWWGNAWAAFSLCFDMTCLAGMWTLTAPLARPDDPKSTGAFKTYTFLVVCAQCHGALAWVSLSPSSVLLWILVVRMHPVVRSLEHRFLRHPLSLLPRRYHHIMTLPRVVQCPIPTDVFITERRNSYLRILHPIWSPMQSSLVYPSGFSGAQDSQRASAISFVGGVTAEMSALSLVVSNLLVIITFSYSANTEPISARLSHITSDMSVFTGTRSIAKGAFGTIAATTGSALAVFRGEPDDARLAPAGAHQLSILPALRSLPQVDEGVGFV
ncbi:hypothetical protein BV22DRAFT_1135254 [Leucogyrophana mollusca]|uniref:Uncharacterized protein n=1 Tax=Leucogyrophana mollusca TaxID=85980 RepID=A0ACB8AYG9_9AGAM|nr:hypothetical protein BV22DRAFT_1135254 [Leucogyrophana mollusca]